MGLTYSSAGVDIDAGNRAVQAIKGLSAMATRPEVISGIGSFGGMFALGTYRNPVLVSSVDGVGTKLRIAILLDKHDTVGADLVNHCVNDILTCGAEPLFFMDYFASGALVPEQLAEVVRGISQACVAEKCALLGGETAEMPGMYAPGDYDLAGFIVGVVERELRIEGRSIAPGDALVGLPSSGLHTNGYSLVRKVFGLVDSSAAEARLTLGRHFLEFGRTLGEELLVVHRCYATEIRPVLAKLKAVAHITGGGLVENVPRVLPPGVAARFQRGSWSIAPIFSVLAREGDIEDEEMFRVFNMGLGLVVVCAQQDVSLVLDTIPDAVLVGEVVPRVAGQSVIID